jgi:hypothetical protein
MLAAALAALAAVGGQAPAQVPAGDEGAEAEAAARVQDTNLALLHALLKRRAEMSESPAATADRRHALSFLDSRIAVLRERTGK